MRFLGMLLACALLGTAPATGVRHLTYGYVIYPTGRVNGPVTDFNSQGGGTMEVDILGPAPDGGTLLDARDWWWDAVRPRQAAQCEAYDDGRLLCGMRGSLTFLSDAEAVLLPLLADKFYPGAATPQWRQLYSVRCGSPAQECTNDVTYSAAKAANGVVNITAQGTYDAFQMRRWTMHVDGTIAYDLSAALPTQVHIVSARPSDAIFSSRSVDVKLLKDSHDSN